jgi:hypothetical protein
LNKKVSVFFHHKFIIRRNQQRGIHQTIRAQIPAHSSPKTTDLTRVMLFFEHTQQQKGNKLGNNSNDN